jgi:uncharacterized protein YeaO (DUF488 family)
MTTLHRATAVRRPRRQSVPKRTTSARAPDVRIRRAYEPPAKDGGARVLVDRLWPRGARKEALALDEWVKDVAPSDELRRWFGHDPTRWEEFASRYEAELREPAARARVAELARRALAGPLTLVFGARDEEHNNAVVLRAVVLREARRLAASARRRPASPAARRSATPAARTRLRSSGGSPRSRSRS